MLETRLLNVIPKRSYEEAIVHLASNTAAYYKGLPLVQPQGNETFDISQVCCSMCEKPLVNGMRMFQAPKAGKIKVFKEPDSNQSIDVKVFGEPWGEDDGEHLKSLLLLCGDCVRALESSFLNDRFSGEVIMQNGRPVNSLQDLLNTSLYIFPNQKVIWNERNQELIDEDSIMDHADIIEYSSDQCFIYKKQTAWIMYLAQSEGLEEFTVVDEAFESMVFIEPNPSLPAEIRVKALNTIRLFKLNGLNYDYRGGNYHQINYILNNSETRYDDLKLDGRNKAYNRARAALSQFRNARDLFADNNLLSILKEQQKIIMELNGYRSTWAEVFNGGEDPGGLTSLFGLPTPIPTGPTLTFDEYEASELNRLKDQLVDLENQQQAADSIRQVMQKNINQLAYENEKQAQEIDQLVLNRDDILHFIKNLVLTINDYEDARSIAKKRKINQTIKKHVFEQVIKPPRSRSKMIGSLRNRLIDILDHQITLVH